nr:MAG TPA: hypothetical protein [Caudoviricetes sp.]
MIHILYSNSSHISFRNNFSNLIILFHIILY